MLLALAAGLIAGLAALTRAVQPVLNILEDGFVGEIELDHRLMRAARIGVAFLDHALVGCFRFLETRAGLDAEDVIGITHG
jgi:hypothetical protein